MNRIFAGLCLIALLFPAWSALAGNTEQPEKIIGTLKCKIVPHSGINLLIHSTKELRCEFAPADGSPTKHYKGETGVRFGLDVNINKREAISYSVLGRHFTPGAYQLAGKYSGAGGVASFGLSAGDTAPIEKRDGSISLQPIGARNSGIGVAAGFTYLYLEADKAK